MLSICFLILFFIQLSPEAVSSAGMLLAGSSGLEVLGNLTVSGVNLFSTISQQQTRIAALEQRLASLEATSNAGLVTAFSYWGPSEFWAEISNFPRDSWVRPTTNVPQPITIAVNGTYLILGNARVSNLDSNYDQFWKWRLIQQNTSGVFELSQSFSTGVIPNYASLQGDTVKTNHWIGYLSQGTIIDREYWVSGTSSGTIYVGTDENSAVSLSAIRLGA